MIDSKDNNAYKKQSMFRQFYDSCLGKCVILVVVIIVLLLLAIITAPSTKKMRWQTEDNIHQCLQENDSIEGDAIDEVVRNFGRMVTHADTTLTDKELWAMFKTHNRVEYARHTLYSTAHVHNNLHISGVCIGVGVFGVVIPTMKYSDFLLRTGPVRGDYNKKLIRHTAVPEYFGETNVKVYHYKGDPDD